MAPAVDKLLGCEGRAGLASVDGQARRRGQAPPWLTQPCSPLRDMCHPLACSSNNQAIEVRRKTVTLSRAVVDQGWPLGPASDPFEPHTLHH